MKSFYQTQITGRLHLDFKVNQSWFGKEKRQKNKNSNISDLSHGYVVKGHRESIKQNSI